MKCFPSSSSPSGGGPKHSSHFSLASVHGSDSHANVVRLRTTKATARHERCMTLDLAQSQPGGKQTCLCPPPSDAGPARRRGSGAVRRPIGGPRYPFRFARPRACASASTRAAPASFPRPLVLALGAESLLGPEERQRELELLEG